MKNKKGNIWIGILLISLCVILWWVIVSILSILYSLTSGPTVDTMMPAINDQVDLYLFPGVGINNPLMIINDTVYDIFYEGAYLGEFESNKANPLTIELNESVLNESVLVNDTNKSLSFVPGDNLLILARSKNGTFNGYKIYTLFIEYIVPDRAVDIIVPELYDVRESEFNFRVEDEAIMRLYHNPSSISVTTIGAGDMYGFDIKISSDTPKGMFPLFGCVYDRYQIRDLGVSLDSLNSWYFHFSPIIFNDIYSLGWDQTFNIHIETRPEFTNSTITCYFLDKDFFMDEYGDIIYSAYDHNLKDLGLPNPSFEIMLTNGDSD